VYVPHVLHAGATETVWQQSLPRFRIGVRAYRPRRPRVLVLQHVLQAGAQETEVAQLLQPVAATGADVYMPLQPQLLAGMTDIMTVWSATIGIATTGVGSTTEAGWLVTVTSLGEATLASWANAQTDNDATATKERNLRIRILSLRLENSRTVPGRQFNRLGKF
jgi:hypothetical protein